jgi:hypothetical protein
MPRIGRHLWTVSGIAGLAVLCIIMADVSVSLKKENAQVKTQQGEMRALRNEYLARKGAIDMVESRKSLTRADGVIQAVDEVFRSLGLSQNVKSVKSTGSIEKKYAFEEQADVQVEKVNMNEMTNILYKLENAPMVLSIKKATIKTSFENPTLLNLSLTLDFIKPK